MPSARILSATALIERDTAGTLADTGELAPGWETIAASQPCAPPQPMTDRLRRTVAADVAATDYVSFLAIGADVAKGDRLTIDGTAYRVEAIERWTSGPGAAHHVKAGMKVLTDDEPEAVS